MRILIVDDHPVILSGCRAMLSPHSDIDVIDALDSTQAFDTYVEMRPDVAVIDVNLPGMSGFALTRRILDFDPQARIIIFTMNDDPIFAARAIENGAKGYIGKCEDPARFVAAIRAVATGQTFLLPEMAQKLAFLDPGRRDFLTGLNARELEILRLLRSGKSMAEIAGIINVSYKTVANCCAVLKRKLGARTPLDLVRIAVENKLA
ncbi:response regulator transcription factor [uncultured Methylovirgula sp.]|uniref:response regulator transcription factor n=1 Tax=uncultured Methylovirgula sp. TaxID=1285960 RepID=UPI00260BA605|nr:response regulator transcription factor [uncultured Methylovirgula sp.]